MLHIVWSKEKIVVEFQIKALPMQTGSLTVKVLVGSCTIWIITIKAHARTIIIVKCHLFLLIKQVLDPFRFLLEIQVQRAAQKDSESKAGAPAWRKNAKDGIRWVSIQHTWHGFSIPSQKLETPDQIQCLCSKLSNSNKTAWTESWARAMFKCFYKYDMCWPVFDDTMATVVEFTSVFVIVPFRAYMEPKVRCVFLSRAWWFKDVQSVYNIYPFAWNSAAARHGSQKCLRAQQNLVGLLWVSKVDILRDSQWWRISWAWSVVAFMWIN